MKLTPIPQDHTTFLFHVSEYEQDLLHVNCDIAMEEYLAWLLVDLGLPVLTPPWWTAPDLPFEAQVTRDFHMKEIYKTLTEMLYENGWTGEEELLVCVQGRAYCSISFLKERAG
jgi:hypothetical protein